MRAGIKAEISPEHLTRGFDMHEAQWFGNRRMVAVFTPYGVDLDGCSIVSAMLLLSARDVARLLWPNPAAARAAARFATTALYVAETCRLAAEALHERTPA